MRERKKKSNGREEAQGLKQTKTKEEPRWVGPSRVMVSTAAFRSSASLMCFKDWVPDVRFEVGAIVFIEAFAGP